MSEDTEPYGLYIDGEFVASTGDNRIDVEYPYDSTAWATVPARTAADVGRSGEVADPFTLG